MSLNPKTPLPLTNIPGGAIASSVAQRLEDEHVRLAGMLDKTISAITLQASPSEVNTILLELSGYTLNHFREEEEVMRTCGFPGIEGHRQEHEKLASHIRGLLDMQSKRDALQGAVNALGMWMGAHIRVADKELTRFMQTKKA
jgi:hemerythrin